MGSWDGAVDVEGQRVKVRVSSSSPPTTMPPSSSIVLARHAGTVLGLSEGLDGPSNLRVAASAIDPFFTVVSDDRPLYGASVQRAQPLGSTIQLTLTLNDRNFR